MKNYVLILFQAIFLLSLNGYAQGGKVKIINANTLELVTRGDEKIRKLIGQVQLEQDNTVLYCDSAYLFDRTNYVEAYKNVRINHNDSVNFYGDILKYDGQKRTARLEHNVSMVDRNSTLTCNELDFDFNQNKASYYTRGKLVSGESVLTSVIGHYYTTRKELYFKKNVVLVSPDFNMTCDTLKYHTPSKVATFYGHTVIASSTDTVYCRAGTYNTETQKGLLRERATVRSEENTLVADTIIYDRKNKYSKALGNIVMIDTVNKAIVLGHIAELFGKEKRTYVTKEALALGIVDQDTLTIGADTIFTFQRSPTYAKDVLKAYRKVKIFKSDLQAVCDSLVYIRQDSSMTLYDKPVLWSQVNQITGDTIVFYMNNRKLDSMDIYGNSFVISREAAKRYNQIKGRNMKAYFKESKIDYIHVYGNGQSIYYAKEDSAYLGVNVVDCSEMKFRFLAGRISTAQFITLPDAVFYPLNELKPDELKLKGFKWLGRQRPVRQKSLHIKM